MPTHDGCAPDFPQPELDRTFWSRLLRCCCAALIVFVLSAPAALAQAQEAPPALVVQLRDVRDAGVAGVEVIITDDSGATVLARATSDATGAATFGPLLVAEVRVRVQGRLTDGTLLVQPGADAQGIAVILGPPPIMLALRSEADGTVLPDPARELTLEVGGAPAEQVVNLDPQLIPPAPPIPAGLVATIAALPTVLTGDATAVTPPVSPTIVDAAPAQPAASPLWPGLLLLGMLLLGVAAVAVIQLRWRRP